MAELTDADDTRAHHRRRLWRSRPVAVGGGAFALAAFAGGSIVAGPAIGAAAVVAVALLVSLIVYLVARSAAEEDFFAAYAQSRGLRRSEGRSSLPPLSPLLQRGDDRYAERRFDGVLPGGLDGTLALYTYEDESRDSDGNKQTTYYHFTVATTQLPDTAAFVRELFCQRRFGFRFLDSAEDVFRRRQRVEHESAEVDERYEIFCAPDDDLNRARQVLAPSFLVWLSEHSPEAFAFELVAGSLVTNVKGHQKSAAELDQFCQASAAVAQRLQAEATE